MRKSTKYAIAFVIVALVLIFVLWSAGVFQALASVGQPAPTPGAEGDWDIEVTRLVHWDTLSGDGVAAAGVTTSIDVDGQGGRVIGTRADMDDAGAQLDMDVTLINLNTQAFSGQTFQYVMTHGAYDQVEDATTGSDFPLVSPDASDPTIPGIVYDDGGDDSSNPNGNEVDGRYFDVVPASGSELTEAEINVNEAAITAMTPGLQYSLEILVEGLATLTVIYQPTA